MRSKTEHLDGGAPAVPAAARDLAAPAPRAPLSAIVQRAVADPRSLGNAEVAQLQRTIGNAAVAQLLSRAAPRANQTGLPDRLKAGIETFSGLAMDDVRVHYNSAKPADVQALAYARGTDIHLGPGQEKHLPHEAWHVVQQKQGRVKPTLQMKGVAINDEDALEREAERFQNNPSTDSLSDHSIVQTNAYVSLGLRGEMPMQFVRNGLNGPLIHILDGDAKSGLEHVIDNHAYWSIAVNKSKFPRLWGKPDIKACIDDVADLYVGKYYSGDLETSSDHTKRGIKVNTKVVLKGGRIITGYPTTNFGPGSTEDAKIATMQAQKEQAKKADEKQKTGAALAKLPSKPAGWGKPVNQQQQQSTAANTAAGLSATKP